MEKSRDKTIKIQDMTQKSRSQPVLQPPGKQSQDMLDSQNSQNSQQMKQKLDKLPQLIQTNEGDTILETLNRSISMHNIDFQRQKKFHLIDSFVDKSISQNNLFDSVNQNNISKQQSNKGDNIKQRKKFLSSHESLKSKSRLDEDQIEARICFKRMQESFFKETKDKNFSDPTAEGNIKQFYKQNKDLDKILQENRYNNQNDSMFTVVLRKFDKKFLIPSKLGLIQENETDEKKKVQLRLNYMRFGDKYMKVLGHGMSHVTHIKDFQLSQNRISNLSSSKLISSINVNAVKVDLSQNKIGAIGIQNRTCKIQILNLEENNLGSYNTIFLLNSLTINTTLQILNLSKNYIGEDVAPALENYLKRGSLLELYLHWNCLKSQFGKVMFPSLHHNDMLHVLDLSNNSLGVYNQSSDSCIHELSDFFAKNSAIVHLDISYNNIGYQDTVILAQAIQNNKTLYGFHYAGNSGYLDVRGFIIPEKIPKEISGAIHKKRIDSVNFVSKTVKDFRDQELRNNCWICEQWVQQSFEWSDKSGIDVKVDPLFLSLNFENFLPCYYQKPAEEGGKLILERMVPQGDLLYFFSNDVQHLLASDHPQIPQTNVIEFVPNYNNLEIEFKLSEIHRRKIVQKEPIISVINEYLPTIKIHPRVGPYEYIPPKIKKKKVKWTFQNSFYAKFRQDDAELINLLFEYDWEIGKIPKIVKDPAQLILLKEFFRKRYKLIKDTYKWYASFSPSDDIWAIQINSFQDFIDKLKIVDVKVTLDLLNNKFNNMVTGKKGTILISAQSLFATPEKKEELNNFTGFQVDLKLKSNDVEPEIPPLNSTDLFFNPDKKQSHALMLKHFAEAQRMYCDNLALNSGKNFRNVEKGCIRYQFMELIVKIAEEKYILKYQKTKSLFEAVKMLWDEFLLKEFSNPKYNSQNWRNDKFWNQDCDNCYKNYHEIIDYIYQKYSVKKIKNNPYPFMCLEELNQVAIAAGLEQLVQQNIPQIAFNQSMMTQLDELGSDRIFQMSIYEFQEAFARIADEANFPPGHGIYYQSEINTNAQRQKMPLAYKIEGLILKLYDVLCDDQFKKANPRPDKSFFWKNPEESDCEIDAN